MTDHEQEFRRVAELLPELYRNEPIVNTGLQLIRHSDTTEVALLATIKALAGAMAQYRKACLDYASGAPVGAFVIEQPLCQDCAKATGLFCQGCGGQMA